jgi:hypothetical protein
MALKPCTIECEPSDIVPSGLFLFDDDGFGRKYRTLWSPKLSYNSLWNQITKRGWMMHSGVMYMRMCGKIYRNNYSVPK